MRFEKVILCDLEQCYATSALTIGRTMYYLFASEGDKPCYAFSSDSLSRQTVWEHPGGTMSIIPIPGEEGQFLAVQNFGSGFMAQDTVLVWGRYTHKGWIIKKFIELPFIHRFDIVPGTDKNHLVIFTLANSKKNTDDWSDPGKIWAGTLSDDMNEPVDLKIIKENLLMNHGYSRCTYNGKLAIASASSDGIHISIPPLSANDQWNIQKIIDRPISEIAFVDIDDDGETEIATIEPFHGNLFLINKKVDGKWTVVYKYNGSFESGHVAWGGKLCGKPVYIGSERGGEGKLFMISWDKKSLKFTEKVIDTNGGPSNIHVVHDEDHDIILSANHKASQAVIYKVSED